MIRPDAGVRLVLTRLDFGRQQRVNRMTPGLLVSSTSVGAECGCATDTSSPTTSWSLTRYSVFTGCAYRSEFSARLSFSSVCKAVRRLADLPGTDLSVLPTLTVWPASGSASGQVENGRQPDFIVCRLMDVERPARLRNTRRIIIHISLATQM